MSKIIIPQNSSVFCALGLLSADFVLRSDQAVGWDLSRPDDVARVNATAAAMVDAAVDSMAADGFAREDLEILRTADFKFRGQHYELTMPIADDALVPDDAARLAAEFLGLYEKTYGEGTAWAGVPTTMVNYSVTAIARHRKPGFPARTDGTVTDVAPREHRDVYLPAERRRVEIPIYDDASLVIGAIVQGPAIIDATDTTIFVPTGVTAARDSSMNYVLTQ